MFTVRSKRISARRPSGLRICAKKVLIKPLNVRPQPTTATVLDGRKDYGEERFIAAGMLGGRPVVMVWTPLGAAHDFDEACA
ncbi:BrnT family toxin [Nguyenibacter vanlangensis]|uniref:BrnT family toxin n=1 Tax=Nguyenibacter vanlangensis TaxID=1216886 RepID=A0ABZ3D8H1_9PROT